MGALETVVARIPGFVLAVDEELRVLACSPEASERLRIPASAILGRRCYEIMSVVDAETGLACHEQCPLASASSRAGWAYNRLIEGPWTTSRQRRLNCFLLKSVLSDGKRHSFCFFESPEASKTEAHTRALQAMEAIYPTVSGQADFKEAVAVSLKAVLRATASDAAELFLLSPQVHELVLAESQELSAESIEAFRKSALGEGFHELVAGSQAPLMASGARAKAPSPGTLAWYLSAPLVAAGRGLGAIGIASQRRDFDIVTAMRALFLVATQLGVYLRWAYQDREGAQAGDTEGSGIEAVRLRIYCLGRFRLELDGAPLPLERFERAKALVLLKFLAAHRGRLMSRETLMEFLWPEADPRRARENLRVVLHTLRRGLEPEQERSEVSSFIVGRGEMLCLDSSPRIWVDTEEFTQRAYRAARLASQDRTEDALGECQQATELYRGEYMEDEPYSDWCLFERERLKEVYLDLLKRMASILSRQGDLESAIQTCRKAIGVDPLREELHRELMLLLWRTSRRGEALRQYEECKRVLQEEVGVGPARETEALYRSILAGASS
jgi:DNA-binding SARP family transcriptional activator